MESNARQIKALLEVFLKQGSYSQVVGRPPRSYHLLVGRRWWRKKEGSEVSKTVGWIHWARIREVIRAEQDTGTGGRVIVAGQNRQGRLAWRLSANTAVTPDQAGGWLLQQLSVKIDKRTWLSRTNLINDFFTLINLLMIHKVSDSQS